MPFEGHEFPQRIPFPNDTAPGRPAPWADIVPSLRSHIGVDGVERRFLRDPTSTRSTDHAPFAGLSPEVATLNGLRRSAALVVTFDLDGEASVLLTRRSNELRSHRGEVAFPGGRQEPGEDLVETALRETWEEVGLASETLEVLGALTPIVTFASNSAIQPYVAISRTVPEATPMTAEVDRVFSVPLRDLVADGTFIEQRWRRDGPPRPGAALDGSFPIFFYKVPGDVIWGATARILTEFLCDVLGVTWSGPVDPTVGAVG